MERISQLGQDELEKFIMQDATDAELMDYWGKRAISPQRPSRRRRRAIR
jgi:hypothetical protein